MPPMNHPRLWFGPKRIGWRFSPRTWEGWALTAGFALCVVAIATAFEL